MDGWNTSFLLGWPIFRGELLVLGRVKGHDLPARLFCLHAERQPTAVTGVTNKGTMWHHEIPRSLASQQGGDVECEDVSSKPTSDIPLWLVHGDPCGSLEWLIIYYI